MLRIRRFAVAAILGLALVAAVGYAQDGADQQRIEYVRVPLYSVFHPDPQTEAKLERGLFIGGPKLNSADFRIPVEIPVGATILEIGIIGQTSNQMSVRLDRIDWTPVYAVGETAAKEAGAWGVIAVVEKGLQRKVGKPVPDDEKIPTPKREFEEHEFIVNVSLGRSPNATPEERRATASSQRDKVVALWLKIAR